MNTEQKEGAVWKGERRGVEWKRWCENEKGARFEKVEGFCVKRNIGRMNRCEKEEGVFRKGNDTNSGLRQNRKTTKSLFSITVYAKLSQLRNCDSDAIKMVHNLKCFRRSLHPILQSRYIGTTLYPFITGGFFEPIVVHLKTNDCLHKLTCTEDFENICIKLWYAQMHHPLLWLAQMHIYWFHNAVTKTCKTGIFIIRRSIPVFWTATVTELRQLLNCFNLNTFVAVQRLIELNCGICFLKLVCCSYFRVVSWLVAQFHNSQSYY